MINEMALLCNNLHVHYKAFNSRNCLQKGKHSPLSQMLNNEVKGIEFYAVTFNLKVKLHLAAGKVISKLEKVIGALRIKKMKIYKCSLLMSKDLRKVRCYENNTSVISF